MNAITDWIVVGAMFIGWLAGFVLAKGAWSTIACIVPMYAWYLVVEKAMIAWGLA